ncbi:HsdM family class I SAM-dependent methyltransferase [Paraflavitalea pollutisoli]|uniref:HsdM family class I SAM-dependent methyltransferase n=1 Tax=Paraflavitalea pollutisoli TaxID=3034143 RepID=UPI0023EC8973|nr:N-6 DNA methylase [Paraflavitalea sp. H1-2-19X]
MNKQIALALRKNCSTEPYNVDRVIVSAFVYINRINVRYNEFLLKYIIRADEETEYKTLVWFLGLLKKHNVSCTIEDLIELFEFVISPEDRVITGAVYTPSLIRNFIIDKTIPDTPNTTIRIADIACGCGGFLYDAAKRLKELTSKTYASIFAEQLYGLDIQPYSITRTQLLLTLLAVSSGEDKSHFSFNLYTGNTLEFDWKHVIPSFQGFDVIVGNPPYVCSRNIDDQSRLLLPNWKVSKTGHPDLYIPFFQIGLENLLPTGKLGYITMNTFFKSVNGRAIRNYFGENSYQFSIIDFNKIQLFKARSTYTCICLLEKKYSSTISYFRCTNLEQLKTPINYINFPYADLNGWKGWNLNLNQALIKVIENTGTAFHKKFKTRNGLATLKNNVYLFNPSSQNKRYYYLEDGDFVYPIEKNICKDAVNTNLLTTEATINKIKEKIIFPYEYIEEKAVPISLSVLKKKYPNAFNYLNQKKKILATRDKGKGEKYTPWFIYGRNQSLEKLRHKLFFPHITPQTPNFVYNADPDLLFYNGMAAIGANKKELLVLKKLFSSRIFWFYISNTSRSYGSGYYSLSRNYLKDFGIFNFTKKQTIYILSEKDPRKLDAYFENLYQIQLPD